MPRIELRDVWLAMELTGRRLAELPRGAYLPGMTRPLTDGERTALAFLDAAVSVLGSKGVDAGGVALDIRVADSEFLE